MPLPEIKVVLVAMFDPGEAQPGELLLYRQREGLRRIELPGTGLAETWLSDDGVLALVAGVGTANTAISTLALGLASGLDLSRAYWLISGIAGVNPNACPLGSAVWAQWCIDADLAFEIDSREIPGDWSTGILPLGAKEPFGRSTMPDSLFGRPYQVCRLNDGLARWAHALTEDLPLADSPGLAAYRARYTGFPAALQPPAVLLGDNLSGARFWHGRHFNAWAERWVQHWTGGLGRFLTSSMEDSGTLHALKHLDRLGKADFRRVLLLRAASNFTMPPPDQTAIQSLLGEGGDDHFPGMVPSLENGYRAGHAVLRALVDRWAETRERVPEA